MPAKISIALQVEKGGMLSQLEEILASHNEFTIQEADANSPDILIMELDDSNPTNTFGQIAVLRKSAPRTEIFLTGNRTDAGILLESLKAGVREFLPQPLTREDLEQAFTRFRVRYEESHRAQDARSGTILSVMGGKAGVGTTTVAVNLAAGLQQLQRQKSLLLVDLDLQGGELPLFLDVKPSHGLSDLVKDPSRLDSTLVSSLVSTHPTGLSILPLGDEETIASSWSAEWVEPLFDLLSSLFDYLVIDCGQALNSATSQVLERSSSILVVTTLTVPMICRTKRLLDSLQASSLADEKIKLIVNQYTQTSNAPINEAQDILRCKSLWFIPHDYDQASRAINQGQPLTLVAPRAQITRSFSDLAASFVKEQEEENERSGFARYLHALKDRLAIS